MAGAPDVEEYFNCVICSQVFKEPITLHCNHSFCKVCLVRYVNSAVDVAQSLRIPCPVCRQTTPVPDPTRPVNEWVGQIRPNFYIVGLIKALDVKDKDCSICKSRDKITDASFWCDHCESGLCDNCQKYHSEAPSSKSHKVIRISKPASESLQTKREIFCEAHKDKLVEFYCKDCDVMICSTCLIINHRKCDTVMTLADAEKIRSSDMKKQHHVGRSGTHGNKERITLMTKNDTRLCEDKNAPDLTDMAVIITNDTKAIVVTDYNNNCVKCFYTEDHKACHSYLHIDSQPFSVTKLTDDQVAVSVPWLCQISVVKVTPDLIHHSVIETEKWYHGLTAIDQNTLAAGSRMTNSVDLIDLKGTVLNSITTDMADQGLLSWLHYLLPGQALVSWPDYLCVTPSNDIVVADCDKKSVICITQTGELKFRYQPGEGQLNCPRGVTCDQPGFIFIVDSVLHKIIKLTNAGVFVKDVVTSQDGLKYPQSVRVHDGCLYVGHNWGEIKMFRLN